MDNSGIALQALNTVNRGSMGAKKYTACHKLCEFRPFIVQIHRI